MIGLSSIWPKLFFLLVFGLFLTAFTRSWFEVAKKKAAVTGKLVLLSLFFLVWSFLFIQMFVREAIFHHDLSSLRVEDLSSIEVGMRSIVAPAEISKVVSSLNKAKWYEVNHGGWSAEVPLVLRFRSGGQRTYHVAWYPPGQGAVVISQSGFDRGERRVSWSNGYAFCSQLPEALAASGIYLPREDTKPRPVQSEETAYPGWRRKIVPLAIFGFFTIGALRFYLQLIRGVAPVKKGTPGPEALQNLLNPARTMVGLLIVSLILGGFGLRLIYTLFDWPDPTKPANIFGLSLVLLATGSFLAQRRFGRSTQDVRK